jgi:hypothetical protein
MREIYTHLARRGKQLFVLSLLFGKTQLASVLLKLCQNSVDNLRGFSKIRKSFPDKNNKNNNLLKV